MNRTARISKIKMDKLLMGVAISTFIIRLFFLFSLGNDLVRPIRDQQIYLDLARSLYEGKGLICPASDRLDAQPAIAGTKGKIIRNVFSKHHFRGVARYDKPTSFWMPVYPIFLSFLWGIMGQELFAMRLALILLDVGTAIVITLLAVRLFNIKVGALSGFIYALYPYFIYYSVAFMTEPLFILLLAVSLYCYFCFFDEATPQLALCLGIVSGLCFLTRSSVFFLYPILFLILLFRKKYLRRYYAFLAIIPVAFLLTILPWAWRNYSVHKAFFIFPTKGGITFWARNNPDFLEDQFPSPVFSQDEYHAMRKKYLMKFPTFRSGKEVNRNQVFYDRAVEFIRANPMVYAKLCWIRTKWFFSLTGMSPRSYYYRLAAWLTAGLILPLGFIGIIFAIRMNRKAWILSLVVAYNIIFHILVNGDTRFRHPIEPYFIIFASCFIVTAATWAKKKFYPDVDLENFMNRLGLGTSREEIEKVVFHEPGIPTSFDQKNNSVRDADRHKKQDPSDRL